MPIGALVSCLLAMLLFALLDTTAKHLSAFLDVPLLVWGRYLVHLLLMGLTILPGSGRQLLLTRQPGWMVLRGLSLVAVTLLGQLALRTLPLAETTALVFIAPLLVAIFAGPFLGEKVRLRNGLALVIGFVGVLLIVRPGGALAGSGVAYALGAGFCYAGYQLLTRRLTASEPPLRLLFYTALIGTLAMSSLLPITWDGRWPTPGQALLIASLGIYGGVGHFLLIHAFRQSPASLLSPLLYMQLVWASLLGWLVFDHWPDNAAVAGMLLIGIAGLSSAWRSGGRAAGNG
ncbi:MAG TPA: DMT family transporter [Accumulibacter sp.]|nr:DMT family transporter [Accumulibacter sp.]HMW18877.1 DMT family transporter [Accumulibacter sp.]HMX23616.1 DMT family transporter [Accumulibacter sp.]HND80736.1 DMT family transporter [Accumulibacter sp.]HNE14134.1 DMT family transporter [Accumulibacter sp.]